MRSEEEFDAMCRVRFKMSAREVERALGTPDAAERPVEGEGRYRCDGDPRCEFYCAGMCGGAGSCLHEEEIAQGEENMYTFMLAPSPFPVYVTGKGLDDAARKLSNSFSDYARAGFWAGLNVKDIEFHVIPLGGDKSYKAVC